MVQTHTRSRGFTLVELLVTVAIFVLVFGGLFGVIQFTLKLIAISKASTSALSLANERIEYVRSLPYNAVGTVSGIPNGAIPQHSTSTLNGFLFHERVLIQYVDSADDGTGASDSNGILADYKQVKVEFSWATVNGTSSVYLLTNIVPPGIETTAGGGTVTVNVFDATVQPISGAEVRLYNNTTTSTIDVTRYTNALGVAMFSGAPAAANYQITVTDTNYSIDKTYMATTSNPNPTTPPVAVLESAVSTMNFQIDELSDLLIRTIEPETMSNTQDLFDDASKVFSNIDTVVASGNAVLSGGSGAYVPTGTLSSVAITPPIISKWYSAEWNSVTPVSSALLVRIYSVSGGVYTLIPDADLPGNSVGFSVSPIGLSTLDVSTYPSLALHAALTSGDVNVTPVLNDWMLKYVVSEVVIPNVPFTLTGSKVIGTTLAPTPIYKYSGSHTTNGAGEIQLLNLEWDSYSFNLGTGVYDIQEACGDIPYPLDPGVDDTLTLTLVPSETNTLRVSVVDTSNNPVPDALIELSRPGFSETASTTLCGQVFFNTGLNANTDYEIEVQKSGFVTQIIPALEIGGDDILRVTLSI